MPNRSRRILYRAGFLTFCLFPTLVLAGWLANERVIQGAASPLDEAEARPLAEAELSRLLGLTVTLQRISYPGGGRTVLEGMTIADPETGARIAFVPALEMARSEQGLVMTATRPEIAGEQWEALWDVLHDRALRERGVKIVPIELTAQQATLIAPQPERSPTFSDVRVRLAAGKAAIDFRLAGSKSAEPARFEASRDRSHSPPVTRWELHTGGAEFPCVAFVEQAPLLASLGEACVFDGSLWCEETPGGWRGEASGHFKHIDLGRLVSDQFPQVLTGEANLTLNRAEFEGGRLRTAAGAVEAGPGTIGRGLVEAAYVQLTLRNSPQLPDALGESARYAQIKFGFTLDQGGLSLSGACDAEGTILTLENNPQARLLDQPRHVAPVASLVRVLAPAAEIQVPATAETEALLRFLPLPALPTTAPHTAEAPRARLRLQE